MPILRLNKKGQVTAQADNGFGFDFNPVHAISSAFNWATGVVMSAADIAANAAQAAATTALNTANMSVSVVDAPKVLGVSTNIIGASTQGAIDATTGVSSLASQEANSILSAAKAAPSVVTNPSSAADLIVKQALAEAALINATTAVLTKPVENIISTTPLVKEVMPAAELAVGTGAGLASQIPIVGEVLPVGGKILGKVPIVGDVVQGTALILVDAPIVGGLAAPILQSAGVLPPQQQQQEQAPQIVEEIRYVYEEGEQPVEVSEEQTAINQATALSAETAKEKNYLEHPLAAYFR